MYIFDISIFGLHIAPTWYGLSYALGFIVCYFFLKTYFHFKKTGDLDTLLTFVFFGIVLGGRIGYILLYNFEFFISHPLQILRVGEGGMSFHGGFIGTVIAVYFFSRKYGYQFWTLIDTLAVIVPVAIGLGRIGNWINRELPGYTPYGGIFPMDIGGITHFPSPLFEMLLEGVVLYVVMITFYKNTPGRKPGFLSGVFLLGYSIARLIAEQFRLPDTHIGYLLSTGYLTLGMMYTLPMLIYGLYLLRARR